MSEASLLTFPCRFPIKMMGRDTEAFRLTARALVETHTGPIGDDSICASLSSKRNFVAITITVNALSQEQLDNIYRDVSSHDDVLMAL